MPALSNLKIASFSSCSFFFKHAVAPPPPHVSFLCLMSGLLYPLEISFPCLKLVNSNQPAYELFMYFSPLLLSSFFSHSPRCIRCVKPLPGTYCLALDFWLPVSGLLYPFNFGSWPSCIVSSPFYSILNLTSDPTSVSFYHCTKKKKSHSSRPSLTSILPSQQCRGQTLGSHGPTLFLVLFIIWYPISVIQYLLLF